MFPSRRQWRRWSLLNKLTAGSFYGSIVGIAVSVLLYLLSTESHRPTSNESKVALARPVIEELLTAIDSTPPSRVSKTIPGDDVRELNDVLARDPFAIGRKGVAA